MIETLRRRGSLRIEARLHAEPLVQSERAQAHVEAAGLTRGRIERDDATLTSIGRRLSDAAADNARKLLHGGAHAAAKLTGKGLHASRRWKQQWNDG